MPTLRPLEISRFAHFGGQIRCWISRVQLPQKNDNQMAVCQNLVPLVNIKIAGKWMFIPLKMVLIGIDPYPNVKV